MAMTKMEREIPYCSIILVLLTLTCHTFTLIGNLQTASTIRKVGDSATGWAQVGTAFGHSLKGEIDPMAADVTISLRTTLQCFIEVKEDMDQTIQDAAVTIPKPIQNIGDDVKQVASPGTNLSFLTVASFPEVDDLSPEQLGGFIQSKVSMEYDGLNIPLDLNSKGGKEPRSHTSSAPTPHLKDSEREKRVRLDVAKTATKLKSCFDSMQGANSVIGTWLETFGDRIMGAMDSFSLTIDRVQKLIDKLSEELAKNSDLKQDMLFNSFAIFDHSQTGLVTLQDMQSISELYGITSLQGDKAKELIEKYDETDDGKLGPAEYENLVEDPSVKGIMSIVLRQFAKSLATVSGNLGAAKTRYEIAQSVANYFSLVVAKNKTKVEWISQALSNSSLPMEFTVDVLVELANQVDNPSKSATANTTAQVVVAQMMTYNSSYMFDIVNMAQDPQFWEDQGFDPDQQPVLVERISAWISAAASKSHISHLKIVQFVSMVASSPIDNTRAGMLSQLPNHIRITAEQRMKTRWEQKTLSHIKKYRERMANPVAEMLFEELLGGRTASKGDSKNDPVALQTLNAGVPAAPETLRFAAWLAANSSRTASTFQEDCADYSRKSSNAMQSFGSEVRSMTKKLSSFLQSMQQYASPVGQRKLKDRIDGFRDNAGDQVIAALAMKESNQSKSTQHGNVSSANTLLTLAWADAVALADNLQALLPTVDNLLTQARPLISSLGEGLIRILSTLETKTSSTFHMTSDLYQTVWILYFCIFAVLTINLLFYAMWTSGYFWGPQSDDLNDDRYEAPVGIFARCRTCLSGCCACLRTCHDAHLCFWSCSIFLEIIVLIMFIISIVLCVVSGVRLLSATNCHAIYMLNDESICSDQLSLLRQFTKTIHIEGLDFIENACSERSLLFCEAVYKKMHMSFIFTMCGSILAALFTFQMIIESGVLHERARWRRLLDAQAKLV